MPRVSVPQKCRSRGCYNIARCQYGRCTECCLRECLHDRPRAYCHSPAPRARGRKPHGYIGIEFECIGPLGCFEALRVPYYSDSSIRSEYDGNSFGGGAEIKRAWHCEHAVLRARNFSYRLMKAGLGVNSTCGMHVHLDCRDVHRERAYLFTEWQLSFGNFWRQVFPKFRLDSMAIFDGDPYEHFSAWNLRSTTVECRLHPGSVNPHKVAGWIAYMRDCLHLLRDEQRTLPSHPWEWASQEARDYIHARISNGGVLNTDIGEY